MKILLSIVITLVVSVIVIDWHILKRFKESKHIRLKNAHIAFSALIYIALASIALALFLKLPVNSGGFLWTLYFCLSVLICKFIYAIFTILSKIPKLFKKKESKAIRFIGIAITSVLFIQLVWSAFVTPFQINLHEETIVSKKLPDEFDGYKILHFSDLHAGIYGTDTKVIDRLVKEINSTNPDIIVFTGDIVSHKTSELAPFIKSLKNLKAIDGIFSVLGNHDYGDYAKWANSKEKENNLKELIAINQDSLGWRLLNNENCYIHKGKDSIAVIGVENWGEPPFKQYGNLKKAMPNNTDCFKMLLTHNPKHWEAEVLGKTDIDITFSGHTHAMQSMIELGNKIYSPSSLRYKYWGRLYSVSNQYINVNIGVGMVGIPARFGAKPEISLITLKTK